MCTLLFAHRAHPEHRLVIAANRDEFYNRPTRPAGFWDDAPSVCAGRDLKAGGTWLGITRTGRWSGLTNVREPGVTRRAQRSRGSLVRDFLCGDMTPEAYARAVAGSGAAYDGFNLLVGGPDSVWYVSNRADGAREVTPGVHGVSNHLLDTPWPKVEHGKQLLARALTAEASAEASAEVSTAKASTLDRDGLLAGLANDQFFPDDQLPDTGVGIVWERQLSPLFIATPVYGTRCSTVIAVHRSGSVSLTERTVAPLAAGQTPSVVEHRFQLAV